MAETFRLALVSQVWRGHVPAGHLSYHDVFSRLGAEVVDVRPEPAPTADVAGATTAPNASGGRGRGWLRRAAARSGLLPAWRSARLWRETAARVRAAAGNRAVDAVFLTYLDLGYVAPFLPARVVDAVFPWPWAGVRLHPWAAYGRRSRAFPAEEGVFRAKNCRALAVVDAGFAPIGRACWPGRRVVVAPEIANLAAPARGHPLALRAKEAAHGRKIVGLLGVLTGKKRVDTFVEMARGAAAAGAPWFFVIAGELCDEGPEAAWPGGSLLKVSLPENVLLWPTPLTDGGEFNAVLGACDVLYLAYRPAPERSNVLVKAAHFQKPVLASRGHLMEEEVRRHGLGLVVPSGDAAAGLAALSELAERPPVASRAEFLRRESPERLAEAAGELLEALRT